MDTLAVRTCIRCGLTKPVTEFGVDRRLKTGRIARCSTCRLVWRTKKPGGPICTVEGCAQPTHGRGLCTLHYQRQRKTGQTAIVEPAPRGGGGWSAEPLELAYLAGFLDGEGTIGVRRTSRAALGQSPSYEPYVSAANTNPTVVLVLHGLFGGSYRARATTLGGNARPAIYVWTVKSRAAVAVCGLLLPYLRMKRPQAQVVFDAFLHRRGPGGQRSYDRASLDRLEGLYQRVKALNRRGRPVDEPGTAPTASGG